MKKLAIVLTHPIQYYSPIFQLLNERKKIEIKVFYSRPQAATLYDKKFQQNIEWDIPLLDGYEYSFVSSGSKVKQTLQLKKQIQSFSPNAVLFFGWNHLSHFALMLSFKWRIPVFFRGDSTLLDPISKVKSFVRKLVLSTVYFFVDTAFYVGKANKAYFKAAGFKEKYLMYAPHAIDNQRFANGVNEKLLTDWKKQFNLDNETIIFLFSGKFEPKKDPLLLAQAFDAVANQMNAHLFFLGSGLLKAELEKYTTQNNRIHLLPFLNQKDMPTAYHFCDVLVLPSKGPGETWGLAVNEAMACSKAVIVSNRVGCAQNLVSHGKNGYVFEATDQGDLQNCLLRFVNKQITIKMGELSKMIIQDYNFSNIAEVLENNFLSN